MRLAHPKVLPRRVLGLALALFAIGCGTARDAELLEIESVSPTRLSPGKSLRIEGRGFPARREGAVRLEGVRRTPGGAAEEVRYEAPARAGDDGAVRLRVDQRLLDAMGGRATFRGEVRVSFPSAAGGGRLYGVLEGVVVDFIPETAADLALELDRARRGRAVAQRLGVTFDEEERFEGGLRIHAVEAGGIAAGLGLSKGDRIVAMDGLRLYAITDLVPPPGIEATALELMREGSDVPVTVSVPLLVGSELQEEAELWWVAVAAVLLFTVAFIAPAARLTASLARRSPEPDEGALGWLLGARAGLSASHGDRRREPRARRAAFARRLLLALGACAISGAFAGGAVAGRALDTSFGVGILLATSLALRLVAPVMDDAPVEVSLELLAVAVVGAPLSISVACVSLLVGTGHLGQLHEAQGGLPWEWLVFQQPVAFALFPVFAVTALGRVETGAGPAGLAARGHLLVASCLGAAIFLGGWNAPFPELPHTEAQGIAAFVAKCWALVGAGSLARKIGPAAAAWRWTVPLSLAGLVASVVWLAVDVPSVVQAASGPLLAALAGSATLYVLYGRFTRPREVLRVQSFL